jgi:hypothetical protein
MLKPGRDRTDDGLPFHGSQSIESKAEGGKNTTFRSAPRQSQRDRRSGSGSV